MNSLETALQSVHVEEGDVSDIPFIRAKTIQDLERFWPYRSPFNGEQVYKRFNETFPEILKKSSLFVVRKEGGILAYVLISLDEPLVYLAHTVRQYRRLGLCKALLAGLERPFRYSLDSSFAAKVGTRLNGHFDPFAFATLFQGVNNG